MLPISKSRIQSLHPESAITPSCNAQGQVDVVVAMITTSHRPPRLPSVYDYLIDHTGSILYPVDFDAVDRLRNRCRSGAVRLETGVDWSRPRYGDHNRRFENHLHTQHLCYVRAGHAGHADHVVDHVDVPDFAQAPHIG